MTQANLTRAEPICVQIAALGGQGGGVLAEWLAEAAHLAGYPAQVTSIPGVAQRTGATTYYFEILPEMNPPASPVFSLFPDGDGLDLMVALEPLEAARALENGLITERTTVITARSRIYSTAEKVVAGDGALTAAALIAPLERAAAKVIRLDIEAITGRPGAPGNAVMLGAMIGCGILPLDEAACRAAIEAKGVAVAANLANFEAGLKFNGDAAPVTATAEPAERFEPAPAGFEEALAAYPAALRPLVGHALARLVDYQDRDYAAAYLRRLEPMIEADSGTDRALAREVARRLAAWMSYEDVIRVAQLKTRPGRLARIRSEVDLETDGVLTVRDFLKPGREELASLLPPALGRRLMAGAQAGPAGGFRLRIPTTSAWGYAALRAMARLKPWRRRTYRYGREQTAIEDWLAAVRQSAAHDLDLARRVAELAVLARGYGRVRTRGLDRLAAFTAGLAARLRDDPAGLIGDIDKLLWQARHDPDGDCRADA
ncbi:MAG TPA: indolepyruvate oxidoreductase subunit beta family protein [Kiloniellales bacterium]